MVRLVPFDLDTKTETDGEPTRCREVCASIPLAGSKKQAFHSEIHDVFNSSVIIKKDFQQNLN